ncbi:MAG: DUF4136 domain-containing protein [Planctomycetaceae bacterium]|nr:DUF4136 domain-containing protein [Planctomycetaceae bacterium]
MRTTFGLRAAVLLALAGCSDIDVTTSQDPQTDFTTLRTWAWYESVNNDAPDPELSELARRRIKNCIQSELEARGYSWGPADKADMLVKWVAVAGGNVELPPVGFRFGVDDPLARKAGNGPPNLSEGSLVIDVMSNQTPRRIIWRGMAEATVNRSLPDEERQERIRKAVARTLASFPARASK